MDAGRTRLSRKTSFPMGVTHDDDPYERVGRLDISSKLLLAMAAWSRVKETAAQCVMSELHR